MKGSVSLATTCPSTCNYIIEQFNQALVRRHTTLSLTANENILSETARTLGQNRHYDRYLFNAETATGHHYAAEFNGMHVEHFPEVDELKALATEAAQSMFNAAFVEYRVLSGVHCTLSVLAALTSPGDTVFSLAPACGGHFASRPMVHNIGRRSRFLRLDNHGQIDLAGFDEQLHGLGHQPAAVLLDHGLTTVAIAIRPLREMLDRHGFKRTLIIYDASHTLGLIAGQTFANPLDEGADILQGNTHKSLPGPHRALIVCRRADLAQQIEQSISAGLVSSPNLPSLLQLFMTLVEMHHYGKAYAQRMCSNARRLQGALADVPGWTVQPTDTHLLLLEGARCDQAAQRLNELGIRVNNKRIGSRECLRFGVQEITRLGISGQDLDALAAIVGNVLSNSIDPADRHRLAHICQRLNRVHYSFDQQVQP
ncbi:MAG: hypothetical protein RSE94_14565 [Pseudomonas sp.]